MQPATLRRYQSLYFEFRAWLGDDRCLLPIDRVPVLTQYLARIALDGKLSRTLTAAAAITFFWKSELGFNPQDDAAFSAFLRGLRGLQPLLSTPLPRRNELPVWALLHFHNSSPIALTQDDHVLICAALAYGMRGIQRGAQIADLECADVSVFFLQRQAASSPALATLPSNLAVRAVIRTSKTDPNGLRPYDIVIDRGLTAVDPVRLLELYTLRRFGVSLACWNESRFARSKQKFFTSLQGRAISTDSLRVWVRLVARHAGLVGTYGSHSLRIAGACWAALGGLSLETIMAMGGWRSQSSTVIYLRSLIGAMAGASSRMGF